MFIFNELLEQNNYEVLNVPKTIKIKPKLSKCDELQMTIKFLLWGNMFVMYEHNYGLED